MFSGIIDNIGVVTRGETLPFGKSLSVKADGYWTGLPLGASVAIDGVCLTLASVDGHEGRFDVVAETLRRSTLGALTAGSRVNLQKSLAVGDRIDGHFVQGHVDAIARVSEVIDGPAESMWWFEMDAESKKNIVAKGSVAIDGISLTVAAVRRGAFAVALIPTTLDRTTIRSKRAGAKVNVETDVLVRTVVHYLDSLTQVDPQKLSSLAIERLGELGFSRRE
jgi:riboflavin synthase